MSLVISSREKAEKGLRGLGISTADSGETTDILAGASLSCLVVDEGGETCGCCIRGSRDLPFVLCLFIWFTRWPEDVGRLLGCELGIVTWILGLRSLADGMSLESM